MQIKAFQSFEGLLWVVAALVYQAATEPMHSRGHCPEGWTEVPRPNPTHRLTDEVECVMLSPEKTSWYRAKSICITHEADLLELNSAMESEFIQKLAQSEEEYSEWYWLGGNDLATTRRWVWASSGYRIYPYVQWKPNRPNGDGHCMAVEADTFLWFDANCDTPAHFYCEKKIKVEQTEPEVEWHKEMSFEARGYVTLDKKLISHANAMTNELNIEFSTWAPDGLILWQGNRKKTEPDWGLLDDPEYDSDDPNFFALGVEMGRVTYYINDKKIQSNRIINDGLKHQVKIIKKGSAMSLSVDGIVTSSIVPRLDVSVISKMDLFLGGLPTTSPYDGVGQHTDQLFSTGFAGCIHHFSSFNKAEETSANDINQQNDDIYGGVINFAEKQINKASEGVVSSDQCVLPPAPMAPTTRTTTRTTTLKTTSTTPTTTTSKSRPVYVRRDVAFDRRSVLKIRDRLLNLDVINTAGDSVKISIELTTAARKGLLLWQGERTIGEYWDFEGHFLAVAIVNGFVEVKYDFGNGIAVLTSSARPVDGFISDEKKHVIDIRFDTKIAQLSVDGMFIQSGPMGFDFPQTDFYIGGVAPGRSDIVGELYDVNFHGCLNTIVIFRGNVETPISFDRDTIDGFPNKDLFCSALKKPIDEFIPVTTTTTTTTTTTRTTTTTTEDKTCKYETLSFGGNGFVRLREKIIGNIDKDSTVVKFDLRVSTRSDNGLIFWQGLTQEKTNWISLGVKSGRVVFKMRYNSGPDRLSIVSVTSRDKISDGIPHAIVVIIYSDYVSLQIDEKNENTANMESRSSANIRFKSDVFIGGISGGIYSLTSGEYSTGFTGCIIRMEVNQVEQEFSYGTTIVFSDASEMVRERFGVKCVDVCRA